MSWKKKVEKARKLHRPSLANWECDGLHKEFPAFVEDITHRRNKYESFILAHRSSDLMYHNKNDLSREKKRPNENIEMINIPIVMESRTTSTQDFIQYSESKKIPAVICGIPNGEDNESHQKWPALERWKLENLNLDPSIYRRFFKVGEDDDGRSVKLKMKHFIKYLKYNRDDSPLYVFDATFDEDKSAKKLLDDFQVPRYFKEDLFHLVGESRRPPYRWFLVGPQRSGTTIHIDPLATSAWNTLISGKKRWVLFPPHIPKHIVKGTDLIRKGEDDEAIHYFMYILPRIKEQAACFRSRRMSSRAEKYEKYAKAYKNFRCYEFTQDAGETVFIPNGWWHAVLNLTDTVGITQNFCSEQNFDEVWLKTRVGRKKMAWKWLCHLENEYPHLAARAKELNMKDNFVMKYDPMEVSKRKREEEKSQRKKKQAEEKKKSRSKTPSTSRRINSRRIGDSSSSSYSKRSKKKRKYSEHRQIVSPSVSP